MPASETPTPTPWVTAPAPDLAPLTSKVLVALSTSVSAPGAPWITPVAAVRVKVAPPFTAPTSATATGASLTGLMVMVLSSVASKMPPLPTLPPSLVTMVKMTSPLKLLAGAKPGAEALAKYALISAWLPVRVRLLVPEPVMMTVLPANAVATSVPVPTGTLKVTVIVPVAESKSNMLMPFSATLVSSLVAKLPGRLFSGASLTASTVMVLVSASVSMPPTPVLPPSLVVMVSVMLPLKLNTGL